MSPEIRTSVDFRHELDANPRLRLEFLAAISRLLREHGHGIEGSLLSVLTVATESEIATGHEEAAAGPDAPRAASSHG